MASSARRYKLLSKQYVGLPYPAPFLPTLIASPHPAGD
jgi:hypothetical protein